MKFRRADLSAPVLAIIVTIGVVAAGLVMMSWFWWFAPQMARGGSIIVVGTPVLVQTNNGWNLTIAVRNVGNAEVEINGVVVRGVVTSDIRPATATRVGAGQTVTLIASFEDVGLIPSSSEIYTVEGVLLTNAGTYTFSALVIRRPA